MVTPAKAIATCTDVIHNRKKRRFYNLHAFPVLALMWVYGPIESLGDRDPWQIEFDWSFEDPAGGYQEPEEITTGVVPEDPPDGYFNYIPYSDYGPDDWEDVDVRKSEYLLWLNEERNECDGDNQSPIDVYDRASCKDDHKINTRRGRPNFDTIRWEILPHALRANLQVDYSLDSDSARANFSNLSQWVPAVHVEVKVNSEHTLNGEAYPAEMIISHYFDKGNGYFINISILMDYSEDQDNIQLEQFIREWEEVAWQNEASCRDQPYYRSYKKLSLPEKWEVWGVDTVWRSDYDLYAFVTTMWGCGYDGSLTVPPCLERVHWRVLDLPLQISYDQYERMRNLLLNQLDSNCKRGTVAYEGQMNRPIQKTRIRPYCCTCKDYDMNKEDKEYWKGKWPKWYHGNKCF